MTAIRSFRGNPPLRGWLRGEVEPPARAVAGYELLEPLGRGAMATVYRARQLASGGREVALKRVRVPDDAELLARITREGQVLAALDHPHVVRVFELVDDGEGVAIAMQLAAGGSLAALLQRRGRLAPEELVAVAAPVADALASAHRKGVLHRDVKPANILFTSDGAPLLSDFGIARWSAAPGITAAGGVSVGTAEYLDPAVADGGQVDEHSDVYSLGVVCYEALAGRPPFWGPSPLSVLRAADSGECPELSRVAPGVPPALAAVVERAMARQPHDRFATAAEVAAALRSAVPRAVPPRGLPGGAGDDLAADGGPGRRTSRSGATRTFGPRPPKPVVDSPTVRRLSKGALALIAAAVVVVAATVVSSLRHHGARPALAATAVRPARVVRTDCPPLAVPPTGAPGGATVVTGDLDGTGCPVAAIWDGNVLTVPAHGPRPTARFEIGRPGDIALLGDWDCDGRATPALYRPTNGQVFLFRGWATATDPLVSLPAIDTGRVRGVPHVVPDGRTGCDSVSVSVSHA